MSESYAWHYPQQAGMPAPAPNAEKTAEFALGELLATSGRIICHPRDLAALKATALAERISPGGPVVGIPQAGTLWLEVAA